MSSVMIALWLTVSGVPSVMPSVVPGTELVQDVPAVRAAQEPPPAAPDPKAPAPEGAERIAPTSLADAVSALEAANARYLQGDFTGAVRDYEQLVQAGFASANLFYNLGNAYLRSNRIGWAVLSYERALRMAPGDADARANLELATSASVDRLVGALDEPFLDRLLSRLPHQESTATFAAAWLALWGLLLARRRTFGHTRGWLGAAALVAAVLATSSGGVLALHARAERVPRAVVVAPVSPVREAPRTALKPTFELHEGTKVRVLEVNGEFLRIRLPNGLEGWLARSAVAMI